MDFVIATLIVTGAVLILSLALLIRKVSTAKPVTAEWIDELSIERYRPMMRLLDLTEISSSSAHSLVSPCKQTRNCAFSAVRFFAATCAV